jgi:fatty-acyl-CoA synthase
MLISGGFNIYPQELEACLSGCPGILEAAVIGAPDPGFGEIAIAIVAAERGAALDAESCMAYCKPQLGFRTPKRWVFVDALPRTPNGKVDKAQLRKAYGTETAA